MSRYLRNAVAALFASAVLASSVWADQMDPLFERLKNVDPAEYGPIEEKIWREWSKSGSASMDLLLDRGRKAMEDQNYVLAIEHFTALTDHAPNFAMGWHARSTAFYQRKLYGPALADIERALALEPRHFGALSGLAVILEELGRPAQALQVYRAVQAIHPHRENLTTKIEYLEKQTAGQSL